MIANKLSQWVHEFKFTLFRIVVQCFEAQLPLTMLNCIEELNLYFRCITKLVTT